MTFKKIDYIIIAFVLFFLAIVAVSQFYSSENYARVIQPENNAVLALEVSKLTRSNADLRLEVKNLTNDLDQYQDKNTSRQAIFDQYLAESKRYDLINGAVGTKGQGLKIDVNGALSLPQIVDLVNAIKNIGGEMIAINGNRLVLNTGLNGLVGQNKLEIKILGNSKLLQSALERKGGIIEQLSGNNVNFNISSHDNIEIPAVKNGMNFKYSKIIIK